MEKRKTPTFTWIYALAFLTVVAAIVAGLDLFKRAEPSTAVLVLGATLLASGYLGLIGILITLPIAMNLVYVRRNSARHQDELMTSLGDRLQGISVLMNLISEQQLLSDRAKTVAFREKDHDAVARAVREEIAKQNWEPAERLANDIEIGFGYKQEADQFRDEIRTRRTEIQRRQIAEFLAPIDRHIKAEAWGAALQEAHELMDKFPSDPQVQRLPDEIENRRQMRKQQLRASWDEAVYRHDVDGSIEILKKLDLYLTPAEAESMQEIARNVFKEKREALRTRFALAVKAQNWQEALRLGDEIIVDFPNTRIAQEVRDMMETLRQRADEPQTTSA